MKCATCRNAVQPGWKVCPVCAGVLVKKLFCPRCGQRLETGWTRCPRCGGGIGQAGGVVNSAGGGPPAIAIALPPNQRAVTQRKAKRGIGAFLAIVAVMVAGGIFVARSSRMVAPSPLAVESATSHGGTIVIDKRSFGARPAAFVSLERGCVVSLAEVAREGAVEADLWVEPAFPSILGVGKVYGNWPHRGFDTRVAGMGQADYGLIHTVPSVTWREGLTPYEIATRSVFLVKSSGGRVFKVRIDSYNREAIQITYSQVGR